MMTIIASSFMIYRTRKVNSLYPINNIPDIACCIVSLIALTAMDLIYT